MKDQLPTWDQGDRVGSLRRYGAWFSEKARYEFLAAGTHVELFLLVSDQGEVTLLPAFLLPEDKVQRAAAIRQQLQAGAFCGIIHIAEAWLSTVSGSLEKQEALVISMESRDHDRAYGFHPIVRGKDKVALGDAVEVRDGVSGLLANWFGG